MEIIYTTRNLRLEAQVQQRHCKTTYREMLQWKFNPNLCAFDIVLETKHSFVSCLQYIGATRADFCTIAKLTH